jgi:hypothetical protein
MQDNRVVSAQRCPHEGRSPGIKSTCLFFSTKYCFDGGWIFRYLKGTADAHLEFGRSDASLTTGYGDSDFMGDLERDDL